MTTATAPAVCPMVMPCLTGAPTCEDCRRRETLGRIVRDEWIAWARPARRLN